MLENWVLCGQNEVNDMGVLRRTGIDRCIYIMALAHGCVTATLDRQEYRFYFISYLSPRFYLKSFNSGDCKWVVIGT